MTAVEYFWIAYAMAFLINLIIEFVLRPEERCLSTPWISRT